MERLHREALLIPVEAGSESDGNDSKGRFGVNAKKNRWRVSLNRFLVLMYFHVSSASSPVFLRYFYNLMQNDLRLTDRKDMTDAQTKAHCGKRVDRCEYEHDVRMSGQSIILPVQWWRRDSLHLVGYVCRLRMGWFKRIEDRSDLNLGFQPCKGTR